MDVTGGWVSCVLTAAEFVELDAAEVEAAAVEAELDVQLLLPQSLQAVRHVGHASAAVFEQHSAPLLLR
jgi:hypothetical protein